MGDRCESGPLPLRADHDAVGLLESPHGPFRVPALFFERLRVPFATFSAEEIAAIDVDGAGQPRNGIGDRMDKVAPHRVSVTLTKGSCAGGFNPPALGYAPPVYVVLAAGVG